MGTIELYYIVPYSFTREILLVCESYFLFTKRYSFENVTSFTHEMLLVYKCYFLFMKRYSFENVTSFARNYSFYESYSSLRSFALGLLARTFHALPSLVQGSKSTCAHARKSGNSPE